MTAESFPSNPNDFNPDEFLSRDWKKWREYREYLKTLSPEELQKEAYRYRRLYEEMVWHLRNIDEYAADNDFEFPGPDFDVRQRPDSDKN